MPHACGGRQLKTWSCPPSFLRALAVTQCAASSSRCRTVRGRQDDRGQRGIRCVRLGTVGTAHNIGPSLRQPLPIITCCIRHRPERKEAAAQRSWQPTRRKARAVPAARRLLLGAERKLGAVVLETAVLGRKELDITWRQPHDNLWQRQGHHPKHRG